ncbi:MAG TPA: hypothetical protein VFX02_04450 [Gammaproteobacteria bacterium]|nr:hypothetical protein [Gammaproteobacteria bacterium]
MNQTNTQESTKTLTLVIYVLQAAAFFNGLTFVVGVIINYIKLEDVAGTWLASHFRWQMRTFWFGLLWCALGMVTIPIVIGFFILAVTGIWIIYRIVKGILRLLENKEMYVPVVI